MRALCLLMMVPCPVWAAFDCVLQDQTCIAECAQTNVQFEIDETQFVAPQDPNDPPRRQVTMVQMDDARFTAQAIKMAGGVLGFHEDAGELGSVLMIVQGDGSARLVMQPENRILLGSCTED